jgi:hypothetical protein
VKGAQAKRRMKALVLAGEAQGLLAFVQGEPVSWHWGPEPEVR